MTLSPERTEELRRELALMVLAGYSNEVSVMFTGDGTRNGTVLDIVGHCRILIGKVVGVRARIGGEPFQVPEAAAADTCRNLMAIGFCVKSLDHSMLPDGVQEELSYP